MNSKSQLIIVFLMGVIIALVTWNILILSKPQPVLADSGANSQGLIAVTGLVTQSFEGLWVIDARDGERSPSLCLYVPRGSGREIVLAAARRIKWDLQLVTLNDRSKRGLHPFQIKRKLDELEKKEANKAKKK